MNEIRRPQHRYSRLKSELSPFSATTTMPALFGEIEVQKFTFLSVKAVYCEKWLEGTSRLEQIYILNRYLFLSIFKYT